MVIVIVVVHFYIVFCVLFKQVFSSVFLNAASHDILCFSHREHELNRREFCLVLYRNIIQLYFIYKIGVVFSYIPFKKKHDFYSSRKKFEIQIASA